MRVVKTDMSYLLLTQLQVSRRKRLKVRSHTSKDEVVGWRHLRFSAGAHRKSNASLRGLRLRFGRKVSFCHSQTLMFAESQLSAQVLKEGQF